MLGTNEVRRRVHYRCIDRRNRLSSRITFDRAASVTDGIMAGSKMIGTIMMNDRERRATG